ncbi:MAG: hypothetical protein LBH29_04525 [Elusimicrobiota bacterium]|jgi:hypothetical protein|nr:hypothetical protein [Elusimicrobiota bacterium]
MGICIDNKICVLKRELALRRYVYPKRVERKQMPLEDAEYEIRVMQEILVDYMALKDKMTAAELKEDRRALCQ